MTASFCGERMRQWKGDAHLTEDTKRAENVLHPGQYFRLQTTVQDASVEFSGRLQEIACRYLAVALDIETEAFLTAPTAGTEVACAAAGDGCVYRFTAGFRGCSRLPERLWFLDWPETVSRIQMRRYVRVPIDLPLSVRLPGAHGSLHDAEEAALVDIGGGGLCFASADEVMLAAHIAIDIPHLPRYGRLATIARVKRCTPVETPTGRVYHVGVSLEEGLSAREQERLIQSVFELQRSYLQRGLRMPCLNHTACAKSSQRHLRGRAERKEKVEQHGGTGRESRRFDAERI